MTVSQIDVRSAEKPTRRAIKTCARHNDGIQLSKTGLGFFLHQVTKEEIRLQVVDLQDLIWPTEGWFSGHRAQRAIPTVIKTRACHIKRLYLSLQKHSRNFPGASDLGGDRVAMYRQLRTRIWVEIPEMLSAKFSMWNGLS